MKSITLLATLSMVAVSFGAAMLSSAELGMPYGAWKLESVEPRASGSSLALALDSQNDPHVIGLYKVENGPGPFDDVLTVAYYEKFGVLWQREFVAPGRTPSVAIDQSDTIHLVFDGETIDDAAPLQYAIRTPTGWAIETITTANIGSIAMELDSDGVPHVAYAAAAREIHYATRDPDSGVWSTELVESSGNFVGIDIALTPQGDPVIAHEASDVRLHLASRKADGSWEKEVIPTCAQAYDLAIEISGEGDVHAACFTNAGLDYTKKGATGWSAAARLINGDFGWDVDLAVTPGGTPHVAFTNSASATGSNLWHSVKTPFGWLNEQVDVTSLETGWAADVEIDFLGTPRIAYKQYHSHLAVDPVAGHHALRYAEPPASAAGTLAGILSGLEGTLS